MIVRLTEDPCSASAGGGVTWRLLKMVNAEFGLLRPAVGDSEVKTAEVAGEVAGACAGSSRGPELSKAAAGRIAAAFGRPGR